jgi:signal transduction histidine kinase
MTLTLPDMAMSERVGSIALGPGRALSPRQVTLVRTAWAITVGLALALFAISLPYRYDALSAQVAAAQGTRLDQVGLIGWAVHTDVYPPTILSLEILFVAGFVVVSSIIVRGRSRDWRALLFSAVFVCYAVWVTPTMDALPELSGWSIVPHLVQAAGVVLAVLFFLVFPTGTFVPRWAWVSVALWAAYCLAWAVYPDAPFSLIDPFGATVPAFLVLLLAGWGLGLAAQGVRYRHHADARQRRQTKIVVIAVAAACVAYAAVYLPGVLLPDSGNARVLYGLFAVPLFLLLALPMPPALTAAMVREQLFDVPRAISKGIVLGLLAVFITVVYVGIVVGLGTLIGRTGGSSLALSILATAVVAVAFQPMKERAARFANRLVYGHRATPYEVLSEFSERMASAYASDELLPRMARALAEGTGANAARVYLMVGPELRPEAVWPSDAALGAVLPVPDGERPEGWTAAREASGATVLLPVHDRGALLGALTLAKPPGEPLTATEQRLAADLASQAGLVLRNVRLTEELLLRLQELDASRRRIVRAQDEARRRLERNIHDGAQQQLVAMTVKLRLARQFAIPDPPRSESILAKLEDEATEALETLRDLARGIYPPLLADRGIADALEAQARKVPIPVTVEAAGIGRYPQEVEAAVYFCGLEALQNVSKYAAASSATVRVAEHEGMLEFSVTDDGVGFDPDTMTPGSGLQGMKDRLAALGGSLDVRAVPGRGTTISGRIPIAQVRRTPGIAAG